MSQRSRITVWLKRGCVVLGLMAMVLVAGVLVLAATSGGSTSGTLANGRSVTASADAWYLETQFMGDTAQIKTPHFLIVVAPEQLTVNAKPVATIDAAVKAVEVNVKGGTVTFLANGKSVGTYTR
ncbi:hypothetical protein [uncultured Gimesia sp.]|uniref:hypothetical protein n=1 Tax=uncultured Gimesia sp. TaxID=1678688 RepID=UPI002635C893|nr:hypothetical protein [uncultured Gimesia sp.]